MKIYLYAILVFTVILIVLQEGFCIVPSSYKPYISDIKETPSPGGFWKTKTEWKAYWVKDWVAKKIYVPIWKRVWGPAQVRDWIPTGVAKAPPGWSPHATIH